MELHVKIIFITFLVFSFSGFHAIHTITQRLSHPHNFSTMSQLQAQLGTDDVTN